MAITTINVAINSEMERTIKQLCAHTDRTFDELTSDLLERGMKDMCYRIKRNKQKWQETKALNERVKELEEKLAQME